MALFATTRRVRPVERTEDKARIDRTSLRNDRATWTIANTREILQILPGSRRSSVIRYFCDRANTRIREYGQCHSTGSVLAFSRRRYVWRANASYVETRRNRR